MTNYENESSSTDWVLWMDRDPNSPCPTTELSPVKRQRQRQASKGETMSETAIEVMDTDFTTLRPDTTVQEAAKILQQLNQKPGPRVFGLMVTDTENRLVGMFSIYDLLLLARPKHMHIYGEMTDIDFSGLLAKVGRSIRGVLVGDIMSTNLITVTPETHILMIVDLMIKKHVRRIPVLEKGKIVGIVYLSRVFQRLLDHILSE